MRGRWNSNVNGLVGANYATAGAAAVTSSYWDTVTSGKATSVGGVGKTTAEMAVQSTYVGWDFSTVWQVPNATYPALY